ncbi:MAG TPA: FG-GAP-like repeat-containing protein [Pyrinomonadaceae bacterium]|nr:FG-GAP-like repeat-containing protein [Pyrinomonadaceae bacterium]
MGALKAFASAGCTAISFRAAHNYSVGNNPRSVAAGDFNNDGHQDLAVVYAGFPADLAILLGVGGGKFGEAQRIDGGDVPTYVRVADFNKDAKQDLAVVQYSGGVTLLLGSGDGRFVAGGTFSTGTNPVFAVVADFNKDGSPDLAVSNSSHDTGVGNISILIGNGTGGFAPTMNHPAVSVPRELAVADFNGDGQLDVVVVSSAINNAALLLGDGTGNFGPASSFFAATAPFHVVASDFNGDGRPDLAVTSPNHRRVSILLNNGAGGFGQPVEFTTEVTALVAGDFNQDGKADVAGVYQPTNVAGVLFGDGAGGFSRQLSFPTGGKPHAVVAADLNSDQIVDLAVANFGSDDVSVVLGEGNGAFTTASTLRVGSTTSTSWVVAGDFNRDGRPDLVAPDSTRSRAALMLNTGAGQFAAPSYFNVPGLSPDSVAAGDFNNDGDLDLAFIGGGVSILLGNGAGGFTGGHVGPSHAVFVTTTDFNRDGKLDLILVNRSPHSVSVMLGNGAGGLASPVNFAVGIAPMAAIVGDLNGDGSPDLVVPNYDTNNLTILLGNGAGGVASNTNLPTAPRPNFVAINDFNGDGKADLAVTYQDPSKLGVLHGNGAGGFSAAGEYAVGIFPNKVAAGDLNGDGRLDLLVLNNVSNTISTLFGDGAGGFSAAGQLGVGASPRMLALADFNGDSRPDIAVANQGSGNVTLILSAACRTAVGTVQFEAASYSFSEGAERATVSVVRTGDTSGAAVVDYSTADADTFTVGCADRVNNQGGAYARCDFAITVGTLSFAPGEVSKTLTVPIIDDGHAEAAETFQLRISNPSGASLGATAVATITIQDNDAVNAANPIFATPFFVRQHYLDFLSREPEAGEPWSNVLHRCPNVDNDPLCDRIAVSQSFFRSPEFQLKGFYVFRFYRLAFNRLPEYTEIVSDMSYVAGATPQEVYARKAQLATLFTERAEFRNAYGGMTHAQYVAALMGRYQLSQVTMPDPSQPDGTAKVTLTGADLTGRLNANTLTRGQVLRAIADSDAVGALEYNNAFVGMQYYGYLRRKPESAGYDAWLRVLQSGDIRTMVSGFMNSTEYKLRFGQQ